MYPQSTGPVLSSNLRIMAGYKRVSREMQARGHSLDLQQAAIERLAAQEGYKLAFMEEDRQSGSRISRKGYQRIIRAVREGAIQGVIVYMFDRWGRDGVEWLDRAREFDRLGVPIISVQEGRDEGGLMRYIRAGMAEEEAVKLARRSRPAREASARNGIHCGVTPFGYTRVYPAWDGAGKRPPGQLVCDPHTAPIVQQLFQRYATGEWSTRALCAWLNALPDKPRPRKGSYWGTDTLRCMLRNPVYAGLIRYNHHPNGRFETAGPGSMFVVQGQHDALISHELFVLVQQRLGQARARAVNGYTPDAHGPTTRRHFLLSGLVRCAACGSLMVTVHRAPGVNGHHHGEMVCQQRKTGAGPCKATSYRMDLAEAALLAEIGRLRGAPWEPQHDHLLTGDTTGEAALVSRALEGARERLRRHTRRMAEAIEDPAPEEMTAFREVSTELAGEVRALEKQLAAMRVKAENLCRLQMLHEWFSGMEVSAHIADLRAAGKVVELRDDVAALVQSATVVERWPERHSTWVRLAVTWTEDVQMLLDAGLLTLDPEPQRPRLSAEKERRRDLRHQAYLRQRERERRAADTHTPLSTATAPGQTTSHDV